MCREKKRKIKNSKKIHKPEKNTEIDVGIALQKRHITEISCQNEWKNVLWLFNFLSLYIIFTFEERSGKSVKFVTMKQIFDVWWRFAYNNRFFEPTPVDLIKSKNKAFINFWRVFEKIIEDV